MIRTIREIRNRTSYGYEVREYPADKNLCWMGLPLWDQIGEANTGGD